MEKEIKQEIEKLIDVSQTKEQRDADMPKFYVGNGKTFWSKGETPVPQREEQQQATQPVASANDDDLPF